MRRRNTFNRNRSKEKKERLIMLGSAVFVLTALTMTGVYVKGNNQKDKNDGYTIDFSALENSAGEKSAEIGEQAQIEKQTTPSGLTASTEKQNAARNALTDQAKDDFMDYLPSEEIGDASAKNGEDSHPAAEAPVEEEPEFAQAAEFLETSENDESIATAADSVTNVPQPTLNFAENDTLTWPIVGNVLINYSMDKTTYFPTLQQYKYSPAIVIDATQGETITAAADGKVVDIYENEEIGKAVVMDLGGGYQLTYGQLEDLQVSKGSYVKTGEAVGNVAAPTKYYSVEGANVYFKLTKDGVPVNPMGKLN